MPKGAFTPTAVGAHQTVHSDQKLLVQFILVGVKAPIALGCALNQADRDLQKEVVSVRLTPHQMLTSGAVPLVRTRTWTNSGLNELFEMHHGWWGDLFPVCGSYSRVNMPRPANRGQTWANQEIQTLTDIWLDEYINEQLSSTHKNSEIYAIFSKQLREKGYDRSPEQCRIKVKKLRQKHIQIRDALLKTGSSKKEKGKFIWFDEVNRILGTKPVIDPVDIVENEDCHADCRPLSPTASSDVTHASDTDVDYGESFLLLLVVIIKAK